MAAVKSALGDEHPVFTLNFPGHGGVSADEPFSMELFSGALLGFMTEKNIAFADLFGYSMGGYVALWFAWKYPDRVRQVITLGTKLDWTAETAAGMRRMFDAEKIAAKAPQLAQHLATVHAPLDWQQLCRQTADFLQDLGAGKGIPDAAYAQIQCPVHIGRGDADTVVRLEECEKVARLLSNAYLHELKGVPHGIEGADAVALAGWVTEVRGEK
jgi:pimeloyl-ACP methyl ester carboxylesterase